MLMNIIKAGINALGNYAMVFDEIIKMIGGMFSSKAKGVKSPLQ